MELTSYIRANIFVLLIHMHIYVNRLWM